MLRNALNKYSSAQSSEGPALAARRLGGGAGGCGGRAPLHCVEDLHRERAGRRLRLDSARERATRTRVHHAYAGTRGGVAATLSNTLKQPGLRGTNAMRGGLACSDTRKAGRTCTHSHADASSAPTAVAGGR